MEQENRETVGQAVPAVPAGGTGEAEQPEEEGVLFQVVGDTVITFGPHVFRVPAKVTEEDLFVFLGLGEQTVDIMDSDPEPNVVVES